MTNKRTNKPTLPDGSSGKSGGVSLTTTPETPSSRKPPAARDSMDDMRTHVFDSGNFKRPPAEDVNDTLVDGVDSAQFLKPPPVPLSSAALSPQVPSIDDSGNFRKEVSTPLQVISMKTPGAGAAAPDRDTPPRVIPQVQLRAMSDVKPQAPQQNLGFFAPPINPAEVRARKTRDLVIWGCLAVIIASAIAIGMWFLAR